MNKSLQKVMSALLCVPMLCISLSSNSFATEDKLIYGDVDGNGSINSNDALGVLSYCVGNIDLSDKRLTAADVNADGHVDSRDALNILEYSVGLIPSFKAEKKDNTLDPSVCITELNGAISAVGTALPSYLLREKMVDSVESVKLSGNALSIMSAEDIAKLEQNIKDEQNRDRVYTSIIKQGSTASAENLLINLNKISLDDLKSITCTVKENGNRAVDISFKDEKNPSSDSPLVKVFGVETYAEAKDKLSNSDFSGLTVKVDSLNLWYKNAVLSCEYDAETAQLVSLSRSMESVTESKVTSSVLFNSFSVEIKLNSERGETYTDFGY